MELKLARHPAAPSCPNCRVLEGQLDQAMALLRQSSALLEEVEACLPLTPQQIADLAKMYCWREHWERERKRRR